MAIPPFLLESLSRKSVKCLRTTRNFFSPRKPFEGGCRFIYSIVLVLQNV